VEFAASEASKNPQSVRSNYYLGWVLSIASGYRAESPMLEPAVRALERARALPDSNILPDQGLLILAQRTGRPVDADWWRHMQSRLRSHPIGPQEVGALQALVNCMLEHACAFPADDMVATFAAALERGDDPNVLNVYANYVLNILGERELALRLWQRAHALDPGEPQHRYSVIKMLILLGRYDEARAEIAELRRISRFGRYDAEIARLQRRLSEAEARLSD
jgi:tetratricopeptide (TPR) repeat protein